MRKLTDRPNRERDRSAENLAAALAALTIAAAILADALSRVLA